MIEYTNEQLCEHIKKGEKWATERLIEQNKGFVFDCAHKTCSCGLFAISKRWF